MLDVIRFLRDRGMAVRPVEAGGRPISVTWDPRITGPIFGNRALVVLPDLHLGDGGGADIFRGNGGVVEYRTRLERFLEALGFAKDRLEAEGNILKVIQLGDCYDVWRAYPFHENVAGRTYEAIHAAYSKVVSLLIDRLDTRFCIGNHDAILARYPPDWAFAAGGRIAYAQRVSEGRVFTFHGHQTDTIVEEMAAQNGQVAVAIASAFSVLPVVHPALQGLQEWIDQREDAYPDDDGSWPEGDPPPDGPFSAARWSDRGGRERVTERIFEALSASVPSIAAPVRLIIVGHTHRPGVAWITGPDGRPIPVVDVGSWAWGRSQFAIGVEGSVALWEVE
jgi:hypothetical protein